VFMWWSHALISDETYAGINANCDFSKIGPLSEKDMSVEEKKRNDACNDWLSQSSQDMNAVDIYQIYADVCRGAGSDGDRLMSLINEASAHSPFRFKQMRTPAEPGPDPCVGNYMTEYLNRPDVQHAIHANISYPWTQCSPRLNYSYSDLLASMFPVYNKLLNSGSNLRMLVYSGDVDGIVPVTGTRSWLSAMNLPITEPWRKWMLNQQTGGFVQQYRGLTFATVRGAGHMVPYTEPARSFALFSRFLLNQPI